MWLLSKGIKPAVYGGKTHVEPLIEVYIVSSCWGNSFYFFEDMKDNEWLINYILSYSVITGTHSVPLARQGCIIAALLADKSLEISGA